MCAVELKQLLVLMWMLAAVVSDSRDDELAEKARRALEYVERVRNSPCTGGTEETLPVTFDHDAWREYAEVAVRMSNTLTKIMIRNGNNLGSVTDEFLFDLVRNNVDSDSLIFGSAIAVEEYVYPKYRIFCPYAYKKDRVYAHDISLNYNYLDPSTEWYNVLRVQNWTGAAVSENWVTYRYNMTSHDIQRILLQPMALLDQGYWTSPYFDCGGGDIWMVTYSAPIFGMVDSVPVFQGIGTIDIELTNIDINQCDLDGEGQVQQTTKSKSVGVFRGTHHCRPSTQCIPISGAGFVRGSYRCECSKGFYFPDTNAVFKAFNGTVLEDYFANRDSNDTQDDDDDDVSGFQCLQCAEGCESCVDNSPCLYSLKFLIRSVLLILTVVTITAIVASSVMVTIFRDRRAIKSASPFFLHAMNVGGILMCSTMVILFAEPTDISCSIRIWPRHIGYSLAYGALLLKTWRISAIFKVKSARKLNLSDKVVGQRFIPIVAVTVGYLSAWTIVSRPAAVWERTSSDLKFKDCASDWWSYGALIGEACFLLWGAYLSWVVRKAPTHFNESKYITWAIYNNIILGSFVLVIREFMAKSAGPDIIYAVEFVYMQVVVTGMMCLIYAPKVYAVFKGAKDGGAEDMNESVTGRVKAPGNTGGTSHMPGKSSGHSIKEASTQTIVTLSDLDALLPQPGAVKQGLSIGAYTHTRVHPM